MKKTKTNHGLLDTRYGKLAFTLVELIIVIIIIAVLATIAFISLQDYPRNARDGVRKADLRSLEKVMSIYHIEQGAYPIPDHPKTTPTKTGWLEGKLGTGVYEKMQKIHPLPIDPSEKTYYEYELEPTKGLYRIIANLENGNQFVVGNYQTGSFVSPGSLAYCDFSGVYHFGGCLIQ